jgi:hypothetical protein
VNQPSCCNGKIPPAAWNANDVCLQCWGTPAGPADSQLPKEAVRWLDSSGIALLTGLPLDRGLDGAEHLARSIGGMLGRLMPQDRRGNLTCVVRNEGSVFLTPDGLVAPGHPNSSKSNQALDLHNDGAVRWLDEPIDTLVMLAVRPSLSGGETVLASARTAYEILCAEDPAAAATLQEEFVFDRTNIDAPTGATSAGPVFDTRGERFTVRWNRPRIDTAARNAGRPLPRHHRVALDKLGAIFANRELQVRFTLQPGECLLLDDRMVVHGRTAFSDELSRDSHSGRCLVRVWVNRTSTVS